MAIVINGSGTVTGISVGGLPDGIVDAGTLATDSVDSAELIDGSIDTAHIGTDQITSALMPSGSVLQVVTNSQAGDISTTSDSVTATGLITTITPVAASSKLFVTCSGFSLHSNPSGGTNYGVLVYLYNSVNSGSYANAFGSAPVCVNYYNGSTWTDFPASFQVMYTPSYSLGNAIAIQPYYLKGANNGADAGYYFNHAGGNGTTTKQILTVFEIGA
jgi:hypothetical protein